MTFRECYRSTWEWVPNRMGEYRIVHEPVPQEWDIKFIEQRVQDFNIGHIGYDDSRRLAVFIRDAHDQIVGGIVGYTCWSWLAIDFLWVKEDLRGQGFGKRLLEVAEKQALDAGCLQALVDTFDFQAPGFYERHGYVLFGALDGFAGRYRRLYYRKRLAL